jgi:succinoglycan biosynthesis transport protein ExoP
MEMQHYVAAARKRWWLIVTVVLCCTLCGYGITACMPRIYEATTTVRVGQTLDMPNPTPQDFSVSQQLARTYQHMVSRQQILKAAADQLGLEYVPKADSVAARLISSTEFLEIRVRDTNPERASAFADAIAQQLILQTPTEITDEQTRRAFVQGQLQNLEADIRATEEELRASRTAMEESGSVQGQLLAQQSIVVQQQELASYRSTYASLLQTVQHTANHITVFEAASTPSWPVSPRVPRVVSFFAAMGLAAALFLAHLLECRDDKIWTTDDLADATHLPTLGAVGRMNGRGHDDGLAAAVRPRSPVAEAYRALRTSIQCLSVDEELRTITVTSPGLLEGKTTTAANLSIVMAQAGKSVILVDADLRRPMLHTVFDLPNGNGLANLLMQNRPERDGSPQQTDIENLQVLTSGPPPPFPSELLCSQKMKRLIERLAADADVVVLDSPPILPVTDASVLANQTDGVLVVTAAGQTRRTDAARAVKTLRRVQARILGTVLNKSAPLGSTDYYRAERRVRQLQIPRSADLPEESWSHPSNIPEAAD